jgi:large subunit ribosomal protein L17
MRHQKNTRKLGRTSQHRDALLANLVASLIKHKRVKTTLAKAKAARPLAEKLVTLGKGGTLHHRRLAVAKIGQRDAVTKLFAEIAPGFKDRKDSAPVAFLEWVDYVLEVEAAPVEKTDKAGKSDKPKAGKAAKTEEAKSVDVEVVDAPAKKASKPKSQD